MNKMDNNNQVNQNNQEQQPNNNEEVNASSTNQQTPNNNNQESNNNQPTNKEPEVKAGNEQQPANDKPQTVEESWAVIADLKRQLDDEKNAGKLLGTQIDKLKAEVDSLQTARQLDSEKYNHDLEDAKKAIAARLQLRIDEWRKQDEEELKQQIERLQNEYKEKEEYAIAPYAKKLVEILSLFTTVQHEFHIEGYDEAIVAYKRGMQSIHDRFYSLLKDINVEQMKITIGDQFDEGTMKAIDSIPSDKYHHNQVIEVKRPGFTLNGKVLQIADVIVAK